MLYMLWFFLKENLNYCCLFFLLITYIYAYLSIQWAKRKPKKTRLRPSDNRLLFLLSSSSRLICNDENLEKQNKIFLSVSRVFFIYAY